MRFFYDVFNSRRIIYLKILLPRGQSKLDREQEKELAKDMKEKIGRMSQVLLNTLWVIKIGVNLFPPYPQIFSLRPFFDSAVNAAVVDGVF